MYIWAESSGLMRRDKTAGAAETHDGVDGIVDIAFDDSYVYSVSYTHLTLPTTPYV